MVLDCAGGESKAKAHENFEMPCQLQSVIDELARQGKRGIGDDVIHGLRGQCEVLHHKAEATINDIGTGSRQCPPSALVGQIRQIEEGSVSGSS